MSNYLCTGNTLIQSYCCSAHLVLAFEVQYTTTRIIATTIIQIAIAATTPAIMPTGEDDEELVGELVGKLELLGDGVICSTQSGESND